MKKRSIIGLILGLFTVIILTSFGYAGDHKKIPYDPVQVEFSVFIGTEVNYFTFQDFGNEIPKFLKNYGKNSSKKLSGYSGQTINDCLKIPICNSCSNYSTDCTLNC